MPLQHHRLILPVLLPRCAAYVLANICPSAPLFPPPSTGAQDLQRWRQNVRQESLRQAVLPPEVAAQISTAAAVQMRKEG